MTIQRFDDLAASRLPEIGFEEYALPNGLEVILHEDHSTPIVAINVWYHVGSKNERPGRTGFAHLFEHMMFQGSQHHDADYFGPLQEIGGRVNGSTNEDRTNYWEVVPANFLERALWMEADRMGFLLPAMTQEKLDNQRDVVRNERRQSYENRPYGLAYETLSAALYPPDHPYHWPVIGSMADIGAATRDDIGDFFRRFYHPANASLCLAGDFDPDTARRLVERYLGSIPAGPRVEPMSPRGASLDEQRRLVLPDRVSLPRLYCTWPTVPHFAPDDAELDLLASVLGASKSSRLYRALVYERQLAQDVSVYHQSQELAGELVIVVTARPGKSLGEIEQVMLAEIAGLQAEPPAARELERAVNMYEARFVNALDSVGGFGGVSDRLNLYNVFLGDPGGYRSDFARYPGVRPEDVQRVARRYLRAERVVLAVVPATSLGTVQYVAGAAPAVDNGTTPPCTFSASGGGRAHADSFDRSVMPGPGPTPQFHLPPIQRATLDNGVRVLLVEHRELPVLSLNLIMPGGRVFEPADRGGLANLLAAMIDEGTERRSALDIAEELAGIGAALRADVDWDFTTLRMHTLTRHLDRALDVFHDVLLHPTFPEIELERQRALALGRLERLRDEPTSLAYLALDALLYGPEHPYGRPDCGGPQSLRASTRADVVELHRRSVRAESATVIAVGAVALDDLVSRLNDGFAGWPCGEAAELQLPALPAPAATTITLLDKPGAPQSVILVGQVGPPRRSPDYFAMVLLNAIYGGQFSSRLNMNLREDKGYTYGARSAFDWRRVPGPYVAQASVETAVTAAAVREFLAEWRGIAGDRPPSHNELDFAKSYIIRGYPAQFETCRDIAGKLEDLVRYDLPDDYFNRVQPSIAAVTSDDVAEAARRRLDPGHTAVVIVGDARRVEPALHAAADSVPIQHGRLDEEFRFNI
jgi:zinc protease